MITKEIKITNYRNIDFQRIVFDPKFNALVGSNGMGKTNILDAIYCTCLGKSYFSTTDKVVIRQEQDFYRLETVFCKNEDQKVVIKNPLAGRKEIEIDGVKLPKLGDHVGNFLCVVIAPIDIQTMLEGSEERRNFLNNTLVQMDRAYLEDLLLYNNLLKQRNALLKTFLDRGNYNPTLLEVISERMFKPAKHIYEKRYNLVSEMSTVFMKHYEEISGGNEDCQIIYKSTLQDKTMAELLAANVDKDRIMGRTMDGVHKDDLLFLMNDDVLKNYASQGQLKSFVIALKLTQYQLMVNKTGTKPILILDDLFDKLDMTRSSQLMSLLQNEAYGQVFISDTQERRIRSILETIDCSFAIFEIGNGNIIKV